MRAFLHIFLFSVLCVFSAQVQAQNYINKPKSNSASAPSETHARLVANACLGDWEAQKCLKAVSESTLVMAANYAGVLDSKNKDSHVERVKEHCAAATAASRDEFPAYAMKSAYIECANMIYDISEETGIKPDQSHYQLLVGSVLCLEKDRRCAGIEEGLRRYK